MQRSGPNKFEEQLKELFKRYKLELPSIPDSSGRQAYLEYLDALEYEENSLQPVLDRQHVTTEMHAATIAALLSAIESDDAQLIKKVGWIAYNMVTGNDNTNLIIAELANNLSEDLKKININIPSFYAGVLPTNSINAQCTSYRFENLILIDTGCMEMSETLVIAFLAKSNLRQRLKAIEETIKKYVESTIRPNPHIVPNDGINWGSGIVPVIVNSFQRFVLTHEIGHLTLNHVKTYKTGEKTLRDGRKIDVMRKEELQEFQADIWAIKHLIECAKVTGDDMSIAIALAGPFIFYVALCLLKPYTKGKVKF